MTTLQSAYHESLSLADRPCTPNDRSVLALNRAHELRKLELGFYWQRSSYMWALQAAAFAAVALAFRDGRLSQPAVLLPITVFGAVIAFAARLTAQGSKFWQENWESHVDMLEGAVEGRLTQTVIVRRHVGYSVSKINQRLLTLMFAGWLIGFLIVSLVIISPSWLELHPATVWRWQVLPAATALALGLMSLRWRTVSNLRGHEWSNGKWHGQRQPGARRPHEACSVGQRFLNWMTRDHPEPWLITRQTASIDSAKEHTC